MKKVTIALLCALLALASCKKKENTPYAWSITGVNLRDLDAAPAGTIGIPDTKTDADNFFSMVIYPIPAVNTMAVHVRINNTTPLTLTAKLVNVTFAGAPEGTAVENKELAGHIVMVLSKSLAPAPPPDTTGGGINPPAGGWIGGQNAEFSFDVSSLPQGFYRVYVESDKGDQFWDNGWVKR